MNAERLHAIAAAVHNEIEDGEILSKLQKVVNSLQQVVNQPGGPPQQALADNLTQMYEGLKDSPSDSFSPSWRQILSDIGGEELVGINLERRVRDIFERNQITPANALTEIREMHDSLKTFYESLGGIVSAFSHLCIGSEQLAPGECEIGILVPRADVKSKLSLLGAEMKELSFILDTFSEVATGKKQDLEIRNLSSSDFILYLKAGLVVAACLATAVERVVNLYKTMLEIRKLKNEISQQGVPEEKIKGIEDYANELMLKGIKELSVEIVDNYYRGKDGGRKNELINAVSITLNKVANRIDKGYNIEVRVEPPEDTGEAEGKKAKEELKQAKLIQDAGKSLQFIKLEGAPLLSLPEKAAKPKPKGS